MTIAPAWILTYFIHGAIVAAIAWIVTRRMPPRLDGVTEAIWRAALIAPLVSATAQVALGLRPLAGAVDLAALAPRETAPAPAVDPPPAPALDIAMVITAPPASPGPLDRAIPAREGGLDVAGGTILAPAVVGVLLLGSLVHGVRSAGAVLRLRRLLAARAPVTDGPLRAALDRILARAEAPRAVRLSIAPDMPVPIAFGIRRGEICLPSALAARLSARESDVVLAHEVAHLVRRDPLWLAVAIAVDSAGGGLPPGSLVARRLREIAEYRCDALAARLVGSRVAVARGLTEVARVVTSPVPALTAATMSAAGSALGRRVRRLLADGPIDRAPRYGGRAAALAAIAVATASVILAPGIAVTSDPSSARSDGPGAAPDPVAAMLPELVELEAELLVLRAAGAPAALADRLDAEVAALRVRAERAVRLLEGRLAHDQNPLDERLAARNHQGESP
jgi:beta-lactamase regulating signal transducer with metallopeptidase domain